MASPLDFSVQQLAGEMQLKGSENYHSWQAQMTLILQAKGLGKHILPSSIHPSKAAATNTNTTSTAMTTIPVNQDAIDAWETNDAKAAMAIMENILTEPAQLLNGSLQARTMWSTLQAQYEAKGHNLKHQHLIELSTIKYEQFNSITSFIARFKTLVASLSQVGMKLPEQAYVIFFLHALSAAFPGWAQRQRAANRDGELEMEYLMSDIFRHVRCPMP